MAIVSQSKIRRDDYVLQWKWDDIQRLLKEDAERQLREAGIDLPENGLTFMKHINKVKLVQLEEGGPPYKVDKWNAELSLTLPPCDKPLLVLGTQRP